MEPETLKELLTTFRELGTEAKGAFIWYIILSRLPSILWTFGGIGLLWGLLKFLRYVVHVISWEGKLNDVCGVGGPWDTWTKRKRERVLQCLRDHYVETEKD